MDLGDGVLLFSERSDAIAQGQCDGQIRVLVVAVSAGLVVDQGGLHLADRLDQPAGLICQVMLFSSSPSQHCSSTNAQAP